MQIDLKEVFSFDNSYDEKSVNALLKAITDAHIDEFDYLKFKASVQNLENLDMDERTSIKSTFTTAQTLGITKEFIIKTIDHYIGVVNKEKRNFSEALQKTLDNSINKKLSESETLKENLKKLQQKIEEYQEAIKQGTVKLQNVDAEIEEIKSKIESTKNDFLKVITHLEDTINTDKDKIEKII
ncbi:MAG: hypothetical protein R2771_02820 [Saprospiraceae bacterium]